MKRGGKATAKLVAADLTAAMERVASGYAAFAESGPDPTTEDDTKAFTAHHAACRAALAHLEHLARLARAMGIEGIKEMDEADALLAEARGALAAQIPEGAELDDEGEPG